MSETVSGHNKMCISHVEETSELVATLIFDIIYDGAGLGVRYLQQDCHKELV